MLRSRPDTPIVFQKGTGQRYRSVLHRYDGVLVGLEGGGYNRIGGEVDRVPHDIAHFVVEESLALNSGLWGVLAAGGIVQNATFLGGRRPPHAHRRAKAITDRAGEQLRQSEMLVRATSDLALNGTPRDVDALRSAVGERWSLSSINADALERACAGLRDAAVRWHSLDPGESLTLRWRAPPPAGPR